MLTIQVVQTPQELEEVRTLFLEYWDSFGFAPCFQGFEDEVAALPGAYAPPGGRLALGRVDGELAGCVALRRLDDSRCEAKRLYVRVAHRSTGLGRALLEWLLGEARGAGYREIYADTMPVMERALAMYERHGFVRTAPYLAKPSPGAICLKRVL